MILTVTLNPCIDKTALCSGFDANQVNRIKVVAKDFGGKGINVSRALKKLGVETKAFGIGFNKNKSIEAFLSKEDIESWFIPVVGELRTNLKIFDKSNGNTVEINETSGKVAIDTVAVAMCSYGDMLEDIDTVVLAGSIPTGVDNDIYARLIRMARKRNPEVKTVVDAGGELLKNALAEKPYMIKPNVSELASCYDIPADDMDAVLDKARELVASNQTQILLLSDGSRGAYIFTACEEHFVPAVKVEAKSAQGAGDAMVAGACKAIAEGKEPSDILRYAVAAATGAVTKQGTAFCELSEFEGYLSLM